VSETPQDRARQLAQRRAAFRAMAAMAEQVRQANERATAVLRALAAAVARAQDDARAQAQERARARRREQDQ
jgi:hypothetical protein